MLTFLPTPIEDEMLESIAARWYALSGHESLAEFLELAFGQAVSFAKCHLGASVTLSSACGLVLDADQVAQRHTMQPFLSYFLDSTVMQNYRDGKPTRTALRYLPKELRWCPKCAALQRSEFGFAAWLRSHNLPGVQACFRHRRQLEKLVPRKGRLEMVPLDADPALAPEADMYAHWYAREARALLGQSCPVLPHAMVKQALLARIYHNYWREGKVIGYYLDRVFHQLSAALAPALQSWTTNAAGTLRSPAQALRQELARSSRMISPILAIHAARICATRGMRTIIEDAIAEHSKPPPVISKKEQRALKLKAEWKARRARYRASLKRKTSSKKPTSKSK